MLAKIFVGCNVSTPQLAVNIGLKRNWLIFTERIYSAKNTKTGFLDGWLVKSLHNPSNRHPPQHPGCSNLQISNFKIFKSSNFAAMQNTPHIRKVAITRYVTPLREGGSMPAITEADDGFLYVIKFRGAGQGVKALIAELIGGEIARLLGLKIPEIVFATLDESFGRAEGDEEIQDLLKASEGLNLGLHYLSGSTTFDPIVTTIHPLLASKIVWLDCLLMNVDRTARNTNMLWWHKELWLIDHGAALYFHHSWDNYKEQALRPFTHVKDHVLLPLATELQSVDAVFVPVLNDEAIRGIVSLIPDCWLLVDAPFATVAEHREAYTAFLTSRIAHSDIFVKEAQHARANIV